MPPRWRNLIVAKPRMYVANVKGLAKCIWRSPLKFLVVYVGLILIFPAVYCMMPGEFYAPYARMEPAARRDIDDLAVFIKRNVLTQLESPELPSLSSPFYIDKGDVNVFQLSMLDDNSVHFTLRVAIRRSDTPGYFGFPNLKLMIEPKPSVLLHVPKVGAIETGRKIEDAFDQVYGRQITRVDNANDPFSQFGGLPKALPDEIFNSLFHDRELDLILMPLADIEFFERIIQGYKGDPLAFNNSYLRMLYFSSITIMTIGFGDIVPITDRARLLVVFEALTGLVIMGLFFNALANRIKAK